MATAATGWRCTHSVEVVSETATQKQIKVTCYWQNDGWYYDVNGISAWVYCGGQSYQVKNGGWVDSSQGEDSHLAVSCGSYTFTINKTHSAQSLSCYAKIVANSTYVSGTKSSTATTASVAAKTKYTVSYNANGGSGAPASQTKWHGENLTLQSGRPTRTGYTFKGWALSASGSAYYNAGATCAQNKNLTLYAVWQANTYMVTYNANGGTGAPGNQTKTYGATLKLSTVKPTRADYNFKGWATSATATTATYAAGANYTANSAVTLYAVWEIAYEKPRIKNLIVERYAPLINDAGETVGYKVSDEGTYLHVSYDWETDEAFSSALIEWKLASATAWADGDKVETLGVSGKSGTEDKIIGNGAIGADDTYTVRITVRDSDDFTTLLKVVEQSASIAYKVHPPKSAGGEEMFETLFPLKMSGGFRCNKLLASEGAGVNLGDFKTPGFHMSINAATDTYIGIPEGLTGTFTFEVLDAGAEGQVMQRLTACSKTAPAVYIRHFYADSWGEWVMIFNPLVGTVYTATQNVQITVAGIDTMTDGATLNVPAGTYIVTASTVFETGTSAGQRNNQIRLLAGSSSIARERIFAAAYNYAEMRVTAVYTATTSVTFTVQKSSSMTEGKASVTAIKAVRIA